MEKNAKAASILIDYYQSPCGELILGSFEEQLCLCDWVNRKGRAVIDKRIQEALKANYEVGSSDLIAKAILQLNEYFSGERTAFAIPLLFVGTDFQKSVWKELLNIPYGKTLSYKELSFQLGNPKAIRAVANANGANALSLFVPCHRVIGSQHSLTGYAGGLTAKKHLLDLESESLYNYPSLFRDIQ